MPVRSLSTKEVDDLVTSDMSQLTMKERESALHDVHGIVDNDNENESPDLIATRLDELDHELNIIKRLTALETAERMSADYVRGLRLTFLRADNYDTKKAANRMKRYFEEKQGLFGEEKLTKHITLEDLDADDLATLKSGYLQVLPIKDRSGRSIIAMMAMLRTFKCVENALRAHYYVFHSVMEDEKVQKRGVVMIVYYIDVTLGNREVVYKTVKLKNTIPVKIASIHICYNEPKLRPLVSLSLAVVTSYERVRHRAHFGSHVECLYNLLAFGIYYFPATPSGELQTENHLQWLNRRSQLERTRNGSSPVSANCSVGSVTEGAIVSESHDVLLGRGQPIRDNPGNTRFRKLVIQYMDQYENSARLEKRCVAASIVQLSKDTNARFLKKSSEGTWEEVDDATAREKVHHTFRNFRKQHLDQKAS